MLYEVITKEKNIKLFTKHKVFSEVEIHSRYELLLEGYCKQINIEALTMIEMARKEIYPASAAYVKALADSATAKSALGLDISEDSDVLLVKKIASLQNNFSKKTAALEDKVLHLVITSYSIHYTKLYEHTCPNSIQHTMCLMK